LRVDLHVHTCYSPDSISQPAQIVRRLVDRGPDYVAITDHDTIEGALRLKELLPEAVIVGEEIRTSQGEIIGLFLERPVAPGQSPLDTVEEIRAQGGLVYVPHPVDRWRGSALDLEVWDEIVEEIDVVEVFNARVMNMADIRRAEKLAHRYGLARGAGSDAHLLREIGRAWVEVCPFDGPQSFLRALEDAVVGGRRSGWWVHCGSVCARLLGKLGRKGCTHMEADRL